MHDTHYKRSMAFVSIWIINANRAHPSNVGGSVELSSAKSNEHYVDGTLGGGGHAAALLERSYPGGKVLGIDSDVQALERVKGRFAEAVQNGRLVLVHGNFAELARIVDEAGFVSSVDGVLLDLGFSSYQMDDPGRGSRSMPMGHWICALTSHRS